MADFARSAHSGVQAQLDRLSRLSPAGDRLGLERISEVLRRLGRPQDSLPPLFHIAGTNGKGSTVAFLRAALEASGYSVHAFTSPHLVRFNERIRIAGNLVEDEALCNLLTEVLDAGKGIEPSFFEVSTAAAILGFSRSLADACILEVGLGGRLDATNIVENPLVTAITNLALDHQQFLGHGLTDIAAEKAAIAKAGVPLVTQLYPPEVGSRVAEIAHQKGAPVLARGGIWDSIIRQGRLHYRDEAGALDLPLPRLPGRHQGMNASLAVAVLRHQQRFEIPASALVAAMGWADWPARLQRLARGPLSEGRELWLDGGHNPSAARQIASWATHRFSDGKPLHLIFASLSTKDAAGMLEPFKNLRPEIHSVPIPNQSCFLPEELAELACSIGLSASAHESVKSALSSIPLEARVLIFGSLYLAGTVLAANGQIPN